ncbi:TMEM175 family protein [Dactylosporangium sp. NPDC049525]|uniref:TMEM175 family protein n=1 Tax=Dactylosporangium sp. NPDC049525 TaxID=3154730 RepID=UPI003429CF46
MTDQDTVTVAKAVAAERLTFFSDAVIAIAITLLALELPVPEGATNHELLHSVAEDRGEYLAFLISFIVIGAHWSGHHRVFRYVETMGGKLSILTLLWLLMQVITPFATKVLNGDGAFQARFTFYAAVQVTAALLFMAMVLTIRRHGLFREGTPAGATTGALIASGALATAFLVSIPASFVTHYAYAWWVLVPVLSGVARRVYTRRAGRRAAAADADASAVVGG